MLTEEQVNKIKERLLKERGVEEIIQFGSSVCAPQKARDLDLIIFVTDDKKPEEYLNMLEELDLPFDVDLVVEKIDQSLSPNLIKLILGGYKILYGSGRIFHWLGPVNFDPTYEEARVPLDIAKENLELALRKEGIYKDRRVRDAYDSLFNASRLASMTYLSIEETRWGQLKKQLPTNLQAEFQAFINVLHIEYAYNGRYPTNLKEDFSKWHERVKSYISRLEKEVNKEES